MNMPKDKFAQWLNLNPVTQTGNDVLTHSETITPASPEDGKCLAIHASDLFVGEVPLVNGAWCAVFVATRPGLALADLMPGSPYLIAWQEWESRINAQGAATYTPSNLQIYPVPFLVAHQKLYLYATSNITGAAQTMRARLLFTFEKVSTEEYFQALAQFGA